MSTSLSREQHNNMPPSEGYVDIIMTVEEAKSLEKMMSVSYPLSSRSEIDIERMTLGNSVASYYRLQGPDSDLVRYRALDSLYLNLIEPALGVNNITRSSPIITANAKAHFSKTTCSIVYSDSEEAEISKIIPEFKACAHSVFFVGNNSDKFRLKTGEFSPFDMSYLGASLVKYRGVCTDPFSTLYCSNVVLEAVASTKPLNSEEDVATPYELILTPQQVMRLQIEVNDCDLFRRVTIGNCSVGKVVGVNLTPSQAKAYQALFELVSLSQPSSVPVVQGSSEHPATVQLLHQRRLEAQQALSANRARYSLFSVARGAAPLVGLAGTLWVANYLFPAMFPSALSMILGATVTPYVLAVLTILIIAAACCEYFSCSDAAADNTATFSSMC